MDFLALSKQKNLAIEQSNRKQQTIRTTNKCCGKNSHRPQRKDGD